MNGFVDTGLGKITIDTDVIATYAGIIISFLEKIC